MVNARDATDVFYGELLRKKMKKNTWREYWVVLREDRLVFINENEREVAGIIKLTEDTTCKVLGGKSSKRSAARQQPKPTFEYMQDREDGTCKFKLYAKRGVHLLKTDCKSSCEKWIEAISRAVQNLWTNSEKVRGRSAPVSNGKQSIKYQLQRDFRNTWTSMFGYTALSEEDDDNGKLQRDIENTSGMQSAISPQFALTAKGKLQKWINFSRHIRKSDNPINYGVLIEDITY